MVVSFCPGRIRLRFKELRDAEAAAMAEARIKKTPGITGVAINVRTGSLLIEYDTGILPTEQLIEAGRRELAKLNIALDF